MTKFLQRLFRFRNLRSRLLVAFLITTFVPILIVEVVTSFIAFNDARGHNIDQLASVTTLKEAQITSWLNQLQKSLDAQIILDEGRNLPLLTTSPNASTEFKQSYTSILKNFQQAQSTQGVFEELFVLNAQGEILLSTYPEQEGKVQTSAAYFIKGQKGNNIEPPAFYTTFNAYSVIIARPIRNSEGTVVGVLAGRANLKTLDTIMTERTGLGTTGETYLVSSNFAMLTSSRFIETAIGNLYVRSTGANNAINLKEEGASDYNDYRNTPVLGYYKWQPELQVAIIAEQDQSEAYQGVTISLVISIGVSIGLVLIAIIFSFFVSRGITTPIEKLAQLARQVEQGVFTETIEIQREDEIGILAKGFNNMIARVREFINSLEQRVADRTKALAASAEVSRRLSTILDQRELTREVVDQVQTSFGYYHAHIYLFDDKKENLVMVGGTGEAGQKMLMRGHKIVKGRGLVGRAADLNAPVIVPNTAKDPQWLANPLLPLTRAEIAVPIAAGDTVLGVLDVQHNIVNGLGSEDAELLTSLANQVAIALQNIRAIEQAQRQADYESMINTIAQKIRETTTVESALQVAIRELGRATGAAHTVVRLTPNNPAPNDKDA